MYDFKFQKNIKCIKCKNNNCIPFPDDEGFTTCVYCGCSQEVVVFPNIKDEGKTLEDFDFEKENKL